MSQTISITTLIQQQLQGLILQEIESPIEITTTTTTTTQQQANTQTSFSFTNPFATIPLPAAKPVWVRPSPQPCALTSVHADVVIDSYNATVNVTQTYQNNKHTWSEAMYLFPLDQHCAVSAFRAEFDDGTVIRGVVKEKEQAQQEYKQAVKQGKQAALMQQQEHQDNLFTCHLGNIKPYQSVRVIITYVTHLELEAGSKARFVMPQAIAPKYSMMLPWNATSQTTTNTPDNHDATATWSHQHVDNNGNTLSDIVIQITMPSAITDITSPSHDAIIVKHMTEQGKTATVQFNVTGGTDSWRGLDKDVVLLISQSQPYTAHALVEEDPVTHSRVMQLTFIQPVMDLLATSQLHCEIVFIVDRSGSMAGTSMNAVIQTLTIALRSLPTNARFNIISFGNKYSKLWKQSKPYTEQTMTQASQHVKEMQADMGGTELYACLQDILSAPITPGYPRQVFLLTDGQVSNTAELVRLVHAKASQQRLFTFGIGDGVDRNLCTSLASAGHGEAEFVSATSSHNTQYTNATHGFSKTHSSHSTQGDIGTKVINQLSRALQPCLSDVKVDWTPFVKAHGLDMQHLVQIPATPTAIFPASRYFIYATLPPAASNTTSIQPTNYNITVSASSNADVSGPQLNMSMNIATTSTVTQGTTLHKLAARARIKELDDMILQPEYTSQKQGIKQQITQLALAHQLVSSYTSFLAISDTSSRPVYDCLSHHIHVTVDVEPSHPQQFFGGSGGDMGSGIARGSTGMQSRGGMATCKSSRAFAPSRPTGGLYRSHDVRSGGLDRDRAMSGYGSADRCAPSPSSASFGSVPKCSQQPLKKKCAPPSRHSDLSAMSEGQQRLSSTSTTSKGASTSSSSLISSLSSLMGYRAAISHDQSSSEEEASWEDCHEESIKSKQKEYMNHNIPSSSSSYQSNKLSSHDFMLTMIEKQSVQGSFELSADLLSLIRSVYSNIDGIISQLHSMSLSGTIIATLLCIHILQTYCSQYMSETRMILVKAQLYLQKQTSDTSSITTATQTISQSLVC